MRCAPRAISRAAASKYPSLPATACRRTRCSKCGWWKARSAISKATGASRPSASRRARCRTTWTSNSPTSWSGSPWARCSIRSPTHSSTRFASGRSMSTAAGDVLEVEVAYARTDRQALIALRVEVGTPIAQAIERSGVLRQFPEIDLAHNKVGVFGKLADLNTPLRAGDRVEIYRALVADAKALRRQRAERRPAKKDGAAR